MTSTRQLLNFLNVYKSPLSYVNKQLTIGEQLDIIFHEAAQPYARYHKTLQDVLQRIRDNKVYWDKGGNLRTRD